MDVTDVNRVGRILLVRSLVGIVAVKVDGELVLLGRTGHARSGTSHVVESKSVHVARI